MKLKTLFSFLLLNLAFVSIANASESYVYQDEYLNEKVCKPEHIERFATWFTGEVQVVQLVDECEEQDKVSRGMLRDFYQYSTADVALVPSVNIAANGE